MFMISTKFSVSNISSICCRDDADTASLQYSLLGIVGVVAEDAADVVADSHYSDPSL